ncbi:hypothetical protein J6O86_08580 [bacterium]|nr:hypothetical protein [bacterium]
MNICSICQNRTYTLNFTAIPLAKYGYLHDKKQDVMVYQLEKKDVDYLQYISDNIDGFYKKHDIKDDSTKQVVKEAVDAGIEILQSKYEKKAKVLLALSDEEPSAILIGNVLKVDKNGGFHYSSRKNHSKDETELDWLATWNKKILGEGKVIVTEFFHSALKDGFKQIYVRSEVPEKSFAKDFYKKMGFEPLSDEQREIQRENDNRYLIGDFDALEDNIIPMKATTRDIKNSLKKRTEELERKELIHTYSVNLPMKEL